MQPPLYNQAGKTNMTDVNAEISEKAFEENNLKRRTNVVDSHLSQPQANTLCMNTEAQLNGSAGLSGNGHISNMMLPSTTCRNDKTNNVDEKRKHE